MLNRISLASIAAAGVAAQYGTNLGGQDWDNSTEALMYRKWMDAIQGWGYDNFEAHEIKTDDGFMLTVFRVLPKDRPFEYGVPSEKNPILFVPPMTGVGHEWIKGYHYDYVEGNEPMPFQLLERGGHDVWFLYQRAKKYCRRHEEYEVDSPEYWDFSFEEVGTYDLAAVTKFIYERSNMKVGMIGYSQGTTDIFAGLALRYDIFEDITFKVAQMAPCTVRVMEDYGLPKFAWQALWELGVLEIGGPTWDETRAMLEPWMP